MTPATSIFSIKSGVNRFRPGRAFSLIEVMVAVTLMSVIVLGLLAMFSQTQRAFRTGITQVDIMESGRSACESMSREMEQMTPTGLPNTLNCLVKWQPYMLVQSLPGRDAAGQPQWRTNILDDLFFFTRDNRNWQGVGYRVESSSMVGTLYRYETNLSNIELAGVVYEWEREKPSETKFRDAVFGTARRNRVIDGVVHLRVLAYDSNGRLIVPPPDYIMPYGAIGSVGVTNSGQRNLLLAPDLSLEYHFRSNAVPAYLELELGILEKKTVERCRNLPLAAQEKFLETKAGNVQIFRQRIAIRNVQPSVYQ